MAELKFLSENEPRNAIGEWALRIGVAVAFISFGSEKFSSNPGSHWVIMFHQVGAGEWFRYLTGVIEVLGGVLVLIPKTLMLGLLMLAVTMAAAVLIVAFVIGHPGDSIFPGVFLVALVGFILWSRR